MKLSKVKRVLKDALISFAYWTLCLTPYMILIVGVNLHQYVNWMLMQLILIPPLGAVFVWLMRKFGGD